MFRSILKKRRIIYLFNYFVEFKVPDMVLRKTRLHGPILIAGRQALDTSALTRQRLFGNYWKKNLRDVVCSVIHKTPPYASSTHGTPCTSKLHPSNLLRRSIGSGFGKRLPGLVSGVVLHLLSCVFGCAPAICRPISASWLCIRS